MGSGWWWKKIDEGKEKLMERMAFQAIVVPVVKNIPRCF